MFHLSQKGVEFFAAIQGAVKLTFEHSDGTSYSYFASQNTACHLEKALKDADAPTTLWEFAAKNIETGDEDMQKLREILSWKNGGIMLDFSKCISPRSLRSKYFPL